MPALQEIFQSHEGPDFNAKTLAHSVRCSLSSGHTLFSRGSKKYEWARTMIRRLPAGPQHAVLVDLVDGLPYSLACRHSASDVPPVKQCLDAIGELSGYARELLAALIDGRIDEREDARLESMLQSLERTLSQMREAKNAKRMRLVNAK